MTPTVQMNIESKLSGNSVNSLELTVGINQIDWQSDIGRIK